jgi:hypothetical protein
MLKLLAQLEFKVGEEIIHVVGAQSITYEHIKELGSHLIKFALDNIALVEAAKLEKEKAEEKKVLEAVPEPECETCALPE